jgi:pimeloyl-ACP methyl ester carboxylesterase
MRLAAAVAMVAAALLAGLALATRVGVGVIERAHPPRGRFVTVGGTRLHVVELGTKPARPNGLPAVVLLHGASGNLEDMRLALGDELARRHYVILIDRPGHGWSARHGGERATSPAEQAALVDQVLAALAVDKAVMVVHSWAGALGAAYALQQPTRLAGLVMLAPVTHPWTTGIAWYYSLSKIPVVSTLFAYTLALPIGSLLLEPGARVVFSPQLPPEDYLNRAGIALAVRPANFLANARDVADLNTNVAAQAPRYSAITVPTVIMVGDRDGIVSPTIHSLGFVAAVPSAKRIVLPGVGHMPHHTARDRVIEEIENMYAPKQ